MTSHTFYVFLRNFFVKMHALELTIRLILGIGLVLANGFFVAIEFGLTRVRQYNKEEFDTPSLRLAWKMTKNLEVYLTACQVGITASSIALGIVAEPALAAIFKPLFADTVLASVGAGAFLSFLIINLIHLTHGEQTPTYFGVERSKTACKYGAKPLYYFHYLISPIIKVGDTVAKKTLNLFGVEMSGSWLETGEDVIKSRAELRNKLSNVLEKSKITKERQNEIINALKVGGKPVKDAMVPRKKIISLSTEDTAKENYKKIKKHPHSRYPLIGKTVDDYKGIIYTPTIAKQLEKNIDEIDFTKIAEKGMQLSPETTISKAIDKFQSKEQELALITKNGKVQGLLTVTDAVEEILGEFKDPISKK